MLYGMKLSALLAALIITTSAVAGPIQITINPTDPGHLGDFDLTPVHISPSGTPVHSFPTSSGNAVHMSPDVIVMDPSWWSGAGLMFGVQGNSVVLTPKNPLGAISFLIDSAWGSSAHAWVTADWMGGAQSGTVHSGTFRLNQNGVNVGIHANTGACITSVTIDPPKWGFGQIQTADCVTSVPEPGSLSLMGLGLLSLGFFVRRRQHFA